MRKRRITTQQKRRIQNLQQKHLEPNTNSTPLKGLVITRFGKYAEIETTDKKQIQCSIRPNLLDIVAGDRIVYQLETEEQGVIVSLYPRTTVLARVNKHNQAKPIAANITQMCIVISQEPMLSWPLLDSYLVMAASLHVKAIIILNKMDIVSPALAAEIYAIYEPLGYCILQTQLNNENNDNKLKAQLANHVNIFVGQSGVGKSSIISRILPHESTIQIGSLSTHRIQGKHTTSYSKYYHIPTGGALIDSPGVREFSLSQLNLREIAENYIEFQPFISQCKYRNCTHMDTPHCAILNAVEDGIIMRQRYENYVKIVKMIGQHS